MSEDQPPRSLKALAGADHRETLREDLSEVTGEEETIKPAIPSALLHGIGRDRVIGTEVLGYVVKGKLGQGGMGIVYEAEQPVIGKRVAIKVLRPEVAEDPSVVKRLVAEARAVNQVGHRGIIDVFGFGELPDGRQCIVMEYLDGESLEHVIATNRAERRLLPLIETLTILDELLSALAAAHSAGVVHRDLKPSNVFLCTQRDGTRFVKVLDFGIAKSGVVGASPQTNSNMLIGTPAYMAPEQATGGLVTPALDLYAVGCIAYELLTGDPVFSATTIVEMVMKHRDEAPPRPSAKVMSLPDVLDDFVLKLLAKAPGERYQSADEARKVLAPLKKDLSRSSAHVVPLASTPPAPTSDETTQTNVAAEQTVTRTTQPSRSWLWGAIVFLAAAAIGGAAFFFGTH